MTWPWIIAFFTLWAVCLLVLFLVLGQARRFAGLFEAVSDYLRSEAGKEQLASITFGGVINDFVVEDADGRQHSSTEIISSRTIVLFTSDTCEPCVHLLEELQVAGHIIEGVPVRVISTTNRRVALKNGGSNIFFDPDGAAAACVRAFDTISRGIKQHPNPPNTLG